MDDEVFCEAVEDELRQGPLHEALWTRALARAVGDERIARTLYVEWRVQQLKDEAAATARQEQERHHALMEEHKVQREAALTQVHERERQKSKETLTRVISLSIAVILIACIAIYLWSASAP